jgi:hypothetical protein
VQKRSHDFFLAHIPNGPGIDDLGNVIDMARRSEDAKLSLLGPGSVSPFFRQNRSRWKFKSSADYSKE